MGLDIVAFKKLIPAQEAEVDEYGNPIDDAYWRVFDTTLDFTENNWPGRSAGISPGIYAFEDSFDFRAGSYGGYGGFRRALAQLSGHGSPEAVWEQDNPSGPFVELIDFADNEGVIGPEVSAKLARDFAEHEAVILAKAPDDWFRGKYQDWRRAFEMAADGGAVDFR